MRSGAGARGWIGSAAAVAVVDTDFLGNFTGRNGGGLLVVDVASLTVEGSLFEQNAAGLAGGGLHVTDTDQVLVDTVAFDRNLLANLPAKGGGAFVGGCVDATFTGSDWSSNSAAEGGGLLVEDCAGDALVTESTFTDNDALNRGGGINFLNVGGTSLGNTMTGNSAEQGGAVAALGEGISVSFEDDVITDNTAGDRGAAIFGAGLADLISCTTSTQNAFARNSTTPMVFCDQGTLCSCGGL